MPWYAQQNSPDNQLHMQKAKQPPGKDWVEIPGTSDSMTQQQAEQVLVQDVASGAFGTHFGIPSQDNPFTAITDTAHAIGAVGAFLDDAWKTVADGKMWRSLGWLLLGVLLMFVGIGLWIGPSASRMSPGAVVARGARNAFG